VALDDALRRRLVTLARLRWRLDEVGGMGTPGTTVLRDLMEARSPTAVPQSVFETRLLRVLRDAGLPLPTLQHEIRHGGRVIARVDFAYPEAKLAIEADGYQWHSGRIAFERDLARRNALTNLSWDVMHVTWSDLEHPERIVDAIRAALSSSRRPR
jgi:very-short-patch-repair endonuclease